MISSFPVTAVFAGGSAGDAGSGLQLDDSSEARNARVPNAAESASAARPVDVLMSLEQVQDSGHDHAGGGYPRQFFIPVHLALPLLTRTIK